MSKFFIGRPIVAIVISIITVIGGVVAMAKLPVAMLPDIVPPQISVSTTYTGADALTIEQSVATPLEQQMNGVDNMLYMMSTNANDGTMNLKVTFDVGADVKGDLEVHGAIIGICGHHVQHVVHAIHLLLKRCGDRLFNRQSIRAGVGSRYADLRRNDVRKHSDRQ